MAARKKPATIDAYIAAQPVELQKILKAVRATIRKAAPAAKESISYEIPTYKIDGRPLIYFAGHKSHIGLYPTTRGVLEKFGKELAPYTHGKATLRFPVDERIPHGLIGKIVRFKLREMAAKGRKK